MKEVLVHEKVGLFFARYKIGRELSGATRMNLTLSVHTFNVNVSGAGKIIDAASQSDEINTQLYGDYTYICITPANCHILLTAKGYDEAYQISDNGLKADHVPNFHLKMVLDQDWKTGTANFDYVDGEGEWHKVTNAPVKMF